MTYSYSDYVQAVAAEFEFNPISDPTSATPFPDANVNIWLPRAIEYGEQRIYRELDMLATLFDDSTGTLTPDNRNFVLPTDGGSFIVIEQVAVIDGSGNKTQLLPVSKPFLDTAYPNNTHSMTPSIPLVWCPYNQSSIYVGPPPDSAYATVITGTIRPTPLSSTNTSTILTSYIPDLFLMASFISWAGFQRDYGAQSDDPQRALSYESQYQALKASALVEQFRVAFASQGWQAKLPNTLAMPART